MENKAAYKDLMVWQRSMEFASAVIDISEKLDSERKHYRLIEQLEAAATSVPMNIAEGKGRLSKKEFAHFLIIARGSLYETTTLLELFLMRKWVKQEDFVALEKQANEIAKMLNGLHRSLASQDNSS